MKRILKNVSDNDMKIKGLDLKERIIAVGEVVSMEEAEYKNFHNELGRRIASGSIHIEVVETAKEVKEVAPKKETPKEVVEAPKEVKAPKEETPKETPKKEVKEVAKKKKTKAVI